MDRFRLHRCPHSVSRGVIVPHRYRIIVSLPFRSRCRCGGFLGIKKQGTVGNRVGAPRASPWGEMMTGTNRPSAFRCVCSANNSERMVPVNAARVKASGFSAASSISSSWRWRLRRVVRGQERVILARIGLQVRQGPQLRLGSLKRDLSSTSPSPLWGGGSEAAKTRGNNGQVRHGGLQRGKKASSDCSFSFPFPFSFWGTWSPTPSSQALVGNDTAKCSCYSRPSGSSAPCSSQSRRHAVPPRRVVDAFREPIRQLLFLTLTIPGLEPVGI